MISYRRQNFVFFGLIAACSAITMLAYPIINKKWVYFREAEDNFYVKKFKEAIPYYDLSIEKGMKKPEVYIHLADSLSATQQFDKAIYWYEFYLNQFPNDKKVRLSYAKALGYAGRFDDADREFKKIAEPNETPWKALAFICFLQPYL